MKSAKSSGKPKKPKLFLVRRIVGDSMLPTYKPGQIVIALNLKPRLNDVVVAQMAGREVIKRVTKVEKDRYFLLGDNHGGSADSRKYGFVDGEFVLGRVVT